MNVLRPILFTCALLMLVTKLSAQENQSQKLKVYLDGQVVDFSYIRNNTDFVDFVNEALVADVLVIVTELETGSGASRYSLKFCSDGFKALDEIVLRCYTFKYNTHVEKREMFLKTLHAGLLPFVNEKTGLSHLEINTGMELQETLDPWKNWVLSVDAQGRMSLEESSRTTYVNLFGDIKKITDEWRVNGYYHYTNNKREIEKTNGNVILDESPRQYGGLSIVRSINQHWSYGLKAGASSYEIRNIDLESYVRPALECNLFNWDELDWRILTFAYSIGPNYVNFNMPNVAGASYDWNWKHVLRTDLHLLDTWGEVDAWLEGDQFLNNLGYYSYDAGVTFYVRINKLLSLSVGLQTDGLYNKDYEVGNEPSGDELVSLSFENQSWKRYELSCGIRFQFGSIYNNVVNLRL